MCSSTWSAPGRRTAPSVCTSTLRMWPRTWRMPAVRWSRRTPWAPMPVEYIKHSVDSIVTYSEAQVQIIYRRTREQVASIVSATGAAAIRGELEESLASFAPESVLRLSYFDGDEAYILDLVREAYFATPATALDLPRPRWPSYPDSGSQRVVEISLHYHLDEQELVHRREVLDQTVQKMTAILQSQFFTTEELLPATAQAIHAAGGYDPEGGSTAYHALLERGADDQGSPGGSYGL